jgi:ribosomal protein S18 acetylase RimI-like enzyme
VIGVWGMWVHPDHRGRGIGRKLLDAVVDYAKDRAADRVRLRVTETNLSAKGLYERAGFQPTGARRPLRSDPSLDEVEMELVLA